MTEYQYLVAFGLVAAGGILLGVALAGAVLLEHAVFWTVCIRLPARLHNGLKQAARRNGWALTTEIIDRLQRSLEVQP